MAEGMIVSLRSPTWSAQYNVVKLAAFLRRIESDMATPSGNFLKPLVRIVSCRWWKTPSQKGQIGWILPSRIHFARWRSPWVGLTNSFPYRTVLSLWLCSFLILCSDIFEWFCSFLFGRLDRFYHNHSGCCCCRNWDRHRERHAKTSRHCIEWGLWVGTQWEATQKQTWQMPTPSWQNPFLWRLRIRTSTAVQADGTPKADLWKDAEGKSLFCHLSAVAGAGKTFLAVQMVIETLKNSAGQIPHLSRQICHYVSISCVGLGDVGCMRRSFWNPCWTESLSYTRHELHEVGNSRRTSCWQPDQHTIQVQIWPHGRGWSAWHIQAWCFGEWFSEQSRYKKMACAVQSIAVISAQTSLPSRYDWSKTDRGGPLHKTHRRRCCCLSCNPDDKEGLGSLCPDGPPLKTFLFEAATADAVKDYGKYVEHTLSAIQFIVHSYASLSLHHRLALLISDDDFRKEFQPKLDEALRDGFGPKIRFHNLRGFNVGLATGFASWRIWTQKTMKKWSFWTRWSMRKTGAIIRDLYWLRFKDQWLRNWCCHQSTDLSGAYKEHNCMQWSWINLWKVAGSSS